MLQEERLVYIINRLNECSSVSVSQLSKELEVSLSTVQRDLRFLHDTGKVQRSRGGVLSKSYGEILSGVTEISVADKEDLYTKAKEIIARKACEEIQPGECIFLDSGTTIAFMIPYLIQKGVTVVTNSFYIMRKFNPSDLDIIMLGGKFYSKYDMTLGAQVISQIEELRFDRAFLSTCGIDLRSNEIYAVDIEIAQIKKMVIERSKHVSVLMDGSKFGVQAIHIYAKTTDVDAIYTETFPKNEKRLKNLIICE